MTEDEKLEAVQKVMIDVLGDGPLDFNTFEQKCMEAFRDEFEESESEITVAFAEQQFGFLRTQPPLKRDVDNGVMRVER